MLSTRYHNIHQYVTNVQSEGIYVSNFFVYFWEMSNYNFSNNLQKKKLSDKENFLKVEKSLNFYFEFDYL